MSAARALALLAAACLCAAACGAAATAAAEKKPQLEEEENAPFATALAEIDAQVTEAVKAHADALAAHERAQRKKARKASKQKDPKRHARENVKLRNSLDLKSMRFAAKEGAKKKQPRHVVVAFLSIAWEAMERGKSALAHLEEQIKQFTENTKVEHHNMRAWIKNQETAAVHKIKVERERIGKLMDEVNHLQHIYQDAVAKERAYQKQISFLVAERQLQTTPPLMPTVAAAALTESQYKQTLHNLEVYRTKASKIMQQTAHAISAREHLILQASTWVKDSEKTLKEWAAKQKAVVDERVGRNQKHLAALNNRKTNVAKILADAKKRHAAYLTTLKRLDVQKQVAALQKQLAQYGKEKTGNAYDGGKLDAYRESLKLEVASLQGKLAKMAGSDEVAPPPAAWGVLAGFRPPQLTPAAPYPSFALPTLQPAPLSAQPSGVPGPTVPAFPNPYPWTDPAVNPYGVNAGAAQPAAGAAAAPAPATPAAAAAAGAPPAAAAAPKFRQVNMGSGAPPPMPDFPPPPDADMASLA